VSQLTPDMFRKAAELLRNRAVEPHTHIVAWKALRDRRRRWAYCGDCLQRLDLSLLREGARLT
jgi:hypothetical protein